MKNALEEYVYHIREKLETSLCQHTTDVERESFGKLLTETEDWIYDEGEDAKRSVISQRLEELKKSGERFKLRYDETNARPAAINALSVACDVSSLHACSPLLKLVLAYCSPYNFINAYISTFSGYLI